MVARSVEEIEAYLSKLRGFLSQAKTFDQSDIANQLNVLGLESEERIVIEELKAAQLMESNHIAQFVVEGQPVKDHYVDIRFLGGLLLHLQEMVNHLAAEYGTRSYKTRFSKDFARYNRFFMGALMPTSFGLNITLSEADNVRQAPLFPEGSNRNIGRNAAVVALTSLFDGEATSTQLAEVIASTKARGHYEKIMALLDSNQATLEIRTKYHTTAVRVTASQAKRRRAWIKANQQQTRSLDIRGRLFSGDLIAGTFGIETLDGLRFSGSNSTYAAKWLHILPLGTDVVANVLEITDLHDETSTEIRKRYILRSIFAQDDNQTNEDVEEDIADFEEQSSN